MNGQTGLACLPNIGPRGRRRRMVLAAVAATITALLVAFALLPHLSRVWRLAVFPATWFAVLCYLEARRRTCVVLAARGVRDLDGGSERVTDAAERQASNAQARAIYVRSTVVAGAITAALMLLP